MKNRKIIVSILVMLAIAGTLSSIGNAHAATTEQPAVVTNAYWYSENSTALVSPGSGFLPLFVQFEITGSFSYLNASVNLSYYPNSPFTYSYISGPNIHERSYYNLTYPTAGSTITINQLVNVSSSAKQGIYEVALEITTNSTPGTHYFDTFQLPVLGTPQLTLVNYFTNPPIVYQDQKFIQLTAVISNTGAGPSKNLQIYLTSQDFSILTGTYSVAYLPSGTIENFTFLMNAKDVVGQAPVTLHIGNLTYVLPLYLHNHGSLKITSSIPTLTVGAGSVLEQFNITNTGNKTMLGLNVYLLSPSVVSVHIPSSNPLAALTADNFTLAKLTPGQSVTVTYIVDVSSSANTEAYPAQLYAQWHLNDTAQSFSQAYNFNETVSPTTIQKFTSSFTFTPLNIGVLVLIIVLIGLLVAVSARSRRLKKRMKTNNSQKDTPSLIHREIPEKNGEQRKD